MTYPTTVYSSPSNTNTALVDESAWLFSEESSDADVASDTVDAAPFCGAGVGTASTVGEGEKAVLALLASVVSCCVELTCAASSRNSADTSAGRHSSESRIKASA